MEVGKSLQLVFGKGMSSKQKLKPFDAYDHLLLFIQWQSINVLLESEH